ncbi:MAG: ABC transporter ATP-binding protein [Treponema sp.]|nr:ABC transporter ATP-binding protein [Treponema sp.]
MFGLARKLSGGMEKKYWIYTAISPLFMVGEVLMETTIPLVMAKIVDVGIAEKNSAFVIKSGILMISMALFSLFCGAMCGRTSSVAAFGFSKNLRKKLFSRVQEFSFGNVDKFGTSSLVTRLTTDVTNIQNMYQNVIRSMIRSPMMLFSGTIMACTISLKLALIFFVVTPVLFLTLLLIVKTVYPRFRKLFEKYDNLNRIVQENLIAIRVVKAFVREKHENQKFDEVADELRQTQVNAEKVVILNMPVMQMSIYLCIIAALWFGGNFVLRGEMQVGGLISFISYVSQVLMSLVMMSRLFVMFIMSRASVQRISEVLGEKIEIENNVDCFARTSSAARNDEKIENAGQIDFNHVYFSYDKKAEHSVLIDINLHIPAGSVVGILGGTGSSKSTLVQMIPRLYDVSKGSVCVGGKDVREWNLEELRKKIGFVLQKNVLFSGTIAENLRWGNENATDEEIVQAAKASDADEFVSRFPERYETQLGQGGVNLSGGQKQRLCIARALLKKPAILIMDDSTSAVDTATDLRIRNALKKLLPSTTKLIIAQRIASVQNSDFIVVMNEGKIDGIGTHEELMKSNQIYRETYETQMSEN